MHAYAGANHRMSSGASERIAWAREKSAFQVQLDESSQVAEDATAKLIEERTQHAEALAEADRRRETELADMRKKSLERDAQLLGDILHPTSYILHPTSYILHLTSYILHLTSYTLHLTSCALHLHKPAVEGEQLRLVLGNEAFHLIEHIGFHQLARLSRELAA